MKKTILLISLLAVLFSGCSEYQKLLKSTDYNLKYKRAVEYYNGKSFVKAATLFDELLPIFRGTSKAETISYYSAFCAYGQKDYFLAGGYFRNFNKSFPDSPYAEECLYMNAYCYYMDSPNPRLDQQPTEDAIKAFQLYINRYPNSSRVEKCNTYIDEMRDKLVYKSYLRASNYFDRERYDAAIVALQNSIKDFPGSKYREELMFMLLKSRYKLASLSIVEKKRERFNAAQEEYYAFTDEYPKSKYFKQAENMFEGINSYLSKFKSNK